ncbi:MAG: Biotin--acetyl-CoA-carboxylase ligase [Humibacillus sp.]|nr:Biotin--acetyl-CoA-carboxylase ligase [Humibacillus sp.]
MRDSLDVEHVGAALVTSGQPWRGVEFHAALGSTNTRLRELLTGGAAPTGPYAARPLGADGCRWWVVLTDHQTGGRGRLDRVWQVPDRASVAVSCAVPVSGPAVAGWLPLLAGLALARALRAVGAAAGHELDPRLKWPNDVLLADDGDRKVSGILCELVLRPDGPVVVVGTGVNIDQDRAELPVETATSLALAGARVRREDVVVAYLDELARLLPRTGADASEIGSDAVSDGAPEVVSEVSAQAKAAYRAACSTIGVDVRVHLPGGAVVEGEAMGLDADGGLVVQTGRGPRTFAAGDVVHLRRA